MTVTIQDNADGTQPVPSQAISPPWIIGGVLVGALFLWLALRNADLASAFEALQQASPYWMAAAAVAGMAFMVTKTWRWVLALGPVRQRVHNHPTPFNYLLRLTYLGTAANLVIAHTGELIRARLLSRQSDLHAATVLASIANERLLDFISLVVLVGVALVIDPNTTPLLQTAGLLSLGIVVAGLAIVSLLRSNHPLTTTVGAMAQRVVPVRAYDWLSRQYQHVMTGFELFDHPAIVLRTVLISLLQWSWIILAIWCCTQAVGVTIPLSSAIVVFVLTVIGLTLPSAPAQLGTLQLAFVTGLQLTSTGPAAAFAASLVYTLSVNGVMMLIGAACLFGRNKQR